MTQIAGLLKANPALLVIVVFLGISAVVFAVLAILMLRAGVSLRPPVFLGVFLGIIVGPQALFHLARALAWIPAVDLSWTPRSTRGGVHGYVEVATALGASEGRFNRPEAVLGPDVDPDLVSDLRAMPPFAGAEVAQMGILRSGGSTIAARFSTPEAANRVLMEFLGASIGAVPARSPDGSYTATRPAGDWLKVVQAGRTILAFAGPTEANVARRLQDAQAVAVAAPTGEVAPPWYLRGPALAASLVILIAAATLWFFKGSAWAAAVPAVNGVVRAPEADLRARLLAINALEVPFRVEEQPGGGRLTVTWRFADARWVDLARAQGIRATHRIVLTLDPAAHAVRVTDQASAIDWSAGPGGADITWKTSTGIVFFQVQHRRVLGLVVDANGRLTPNLTYAYRFDLQEMRAPLIAAVTQAGWQWRPTVWSGPVWLRWLTG